MNLGPFIFDIETGARPKADIEMLCPAFDAPSNIKDPEKVAAAISAKRAEWFDNAALSAVTGQVLAIGILDTETDSVTPLTGDEAAVLEAFWSIVAPRDAILGQWIGFYSNRFDVPYLIRRSWALRVSIPPTVMQGRYINPQFIDLMEVYQCGDRQASINLDTLSKWLGVGRKSGKGADFAMLFHSDREKAMAYLENDLRLTAACAERLGVISPAVTNIW